MCTCEIKRGYICHQHLLLKVQADINKSLKNLFHSQTEREMITAQLMNKVLFIHNEMAKEAN